MYHATAAAFMPLPNMEITLAANTKRRAGFCRMERTFQSTGRESDSPSRRQSTAESKRPMDLHAARLMQQINHQQRHHWFNRVLVSREGIHHVIGKGINQQAAGEQKAALSAIS